MPGPLLLIGCGKMGGALLQGWIQKGAQPSHIHVVKAHPNKGHLPQGVNIYASPDELRINPAIIVIAAKPQILGEILPHYKRYQHSLFISVAAGRERAFYKAILGNHVKIVRVMPNTPALIGSGMTVLHRAKDISEMDMASTGALMEAVGEIAWIEEEAMLHPVTALSGGGPAYLFLFIEALGAAGIKAGLPADLSMRLARKTVEGSALLSQSSNEALANMRQAVTSPKGTTIEALHVLMRGGNGLEALLTEALLAASDRSKELAK